jgi:hypothetical protein
VTGGGVFVRPSGALVRAGRVRHTLPGYASGPACGHVCAPWTSATTSLGRT